MTARRRPARFEVRGAYDVYPQHNVMRWFFHVIAGNGRILCHSEQYNTRASAVKACRAVNPKLEIVFK